MTSLPPSQINQAIGVNQVFAGRFGDDFRDHHSLAQVLPSGLGGVADYYVVARQANDLADAAMLALEHKIPYRVIGAGTGTLAGESGFPGLVIHNRTDACTRLGDGSRVVVESGMSLRVLVHRLASLGLGGIEFFSKIPGSVGGAIATTAAANGQKVTSFVREICLFDPDHKKIATLPFSDIATPARTLLFDQSLAFPPILLSATFQLAQISQDEILRRLRVLGGTIKEWPTAAVAKPFVDLIDQVPIEKNFQRELNRLGVRYVPAAELLIFNPAVVRPTQLRQAINLLEQQSVKFGVETSSRITYLGYYQDESQSPNT